MIKKRERYHIQLRNPISITHNIKMAKLTNKKLIELVQAELDANGIKEKVIKAQRTRFSIREYEDGACYYRIWADDESSDGFSLYMIFEPLQEIQRLLAKGYKLVLKQDGACFTDEICFKQ
jgi:hypothetical protein